MKKTIYRSVYFACLALILPLHAGDGGKLNGRYTKEKVINQSFDVEATALLAIDNSYGTVTLSSWDRNRIMIEVRITTNGNDEKKVERRLEEIDVDFVSSPTRVAARTDFGLKGSWNWASRNKVNVQVDYVVKLPVKNSIDINNDYGKIILDRIDGHARISCDYGKIEAGELRGRENRLSFDYTNNSTFGYVNTARIDADYSSFRIHRSNQLNIEADYTQSEVEQVETLNYNSDYGSLKVGRVDNIEGQGDYIGVKLGTVHGNVMVAADYGSVKIDELAPDAGGVNVKTEYTSVKIGYHKDYSFDFEIRTEYAGLSGKEDLQIQISKEKSTEAYYKGYHGRPDSGNQVSITSSFGGISFSKN